jgi:DNA-binding LacI/PurR family transcriptional regulator
MGRLLVEHLARRGHRRIVIVDNSRGCPGDNHFSDGASEALTSAGLPPNAVMVRFLPDIHSVFSEMHRLLSSPAPPTGFVARSLRLAGMVEEAAKASGNASDSLEIAFLDHRDSRAEQSHFTRVQPTLRLEEIATLIGRTLRRLGEDPEWTPEPVIVPVELCHPCGMAEGGRATAKCFGSVP